MPTKMPDIAKTAKRLELTIPDMQLLAEAYRRKHFLDANWMGLGKASEYAKSPLFKRAHKPNPPHLEWWNLTALGEAKLFELEKVWKYHMFKKPETRQAVNFYLFTNA